MSRPRPRSGLVTVWCLPIAVCDRVRVRIAERYADSCSFLKMVPSADGSHASVLFSWDSQESLDGFVEHLLLNPVSVKEGK
jgi:hypothetical protein